MQLKSTSWDLKAGAETYQCWAFPVPAEGLSVVGVDQQVPQVGVHHYAVFTSTGKYPGSDPWTCATMGIDWGLVTGGGLGTPSVAFPEGTAMGVNTAGGTQADPVQMVILQLHMLNASNVPTTIGPAYVNLNGKKDASSLKPVGLLIAGSLDISIPPMSSDFVVQGGCAPGMPLDNVFAVFPHMHQLGTKLTVDVTPMGGMPTRLIEKTWSFGEQGLYPLNGKVAATDQVTVSCTYNNPSAKMVNFGLSTADEMCLGVLYYYPATVPSKYCGFGN
jgi:hypothetical protein